MIQREFGIFLIVGALTVAIDFLTYVLLLGFHVVSVDIAKASGFLAGTLFAYLSNRFWTFGNKSIIAGSVIRFLFLYLITLGVNILINSLVLKQLSNVIFSIQLAFLVATGFSACLNFIGMKFFVFRSIRV